MWFNDASEQYGNQQVILHFGLHLGSVDNVIKLCFVFRFLIVLRSI